MKCNNKLNAIILILVLGLIFQCCDKNKIIRTDYESFIIDIAYDKDYQYPTDFYHESIANGFTYYENTVSTTPRINDDHIWIELATNDREQAFNWSELSNEFSSVNRKIVSERETEKYFEFSRQNIDFENDLMLSRIHKLKYFEPKLDKFLEQDTIGIYNGELSLASVKELIEYLWSCGSMAIYNSKVIESKITEYHDYYEQYIQSISIVYGDFSIKDIIYVYDNYLRINKSDRTLILETNEVKTIEGNDN